MVTNTLVNEPDFQIETPSVNALRVYLAARFSLKPTIKLRSLELRSSGIHCTSRWLDETADPGSDLGDVSKEYIEQVAKQDIDDIDAAEYFVLFSENPLSAWKRGGRHVEFGYAYAQEKKIVVCGPQENVFHYLPGVLVLPTWQDTRDFLEFAQKRKAY